MSTTRTPLAGELLDFDDKVNWFRDDNQRYRLRGITSERFADERQQEECRYLMRFWWHLGMTYREVSYDEMVENVSPEKMAMLERLFDAILHRDFEGIDAWMDGRESRMPMLECRFLGEDDDQSQSAEGLSRLD